jgi:surface protein
MYRLLKTLLFIIIFINVSQAQNFITTMAITNWAKLRLLFNCDTCRWSQLLILGNNLPSGATGSGSFVVGNGFVIISGLPSGGNIRLSIAPTNLKRFYNDNLTHRLRLLDVESWGTANWKSMQDAFYGCSNLNISATDVPDLSLVTNCSRMFYVCSSLTGPSNINTWNTSAVTNMAEMFNSASAFNQNIGAWNTSAVTNMSKMFSNANAFNQDIGSWNTSAVTNMSDMFQSANIFNQNIGAWNTGAVTNMSGMFFNANAFNQDIGSWNTSAVTDMSNMFRNASVFNQNIGSWNTSAVSNMSSMFYNASAFNQNISSWNTSAVSNMSSMFRNASVFNQNIDAWNTSAVANMSSMFYEANTFNQDIGSWNTSAVSNMSSMFYYATAFNQDIGSWNTSTVSNMSSMFHGALTFNQNIGAWNTSAVSNMSSMFQFAYAFNQNISAWNTGSVNNMGNMFSSASAFNQDIGSWNTGAVTNMSSMFGSASAFNQNIGSWNTSAVSNMSGMFFNANAFNQNIGSWNTSAVSNMSGMFNNADAFNQDISYWNTGAVSNMSSMFASASAFNQNLGNWTLNATVNLSNMLNNSGISCQNYSATLQGWSANPLTPNNRILGASNMEYGAYTAAARTNLVSSKSWTISGDVVGSCDDRFITKWQLPAGQTTLSFNCERVGGAVAYTWQQLPSGATGSGSFTAGNGAVSISGLPSGASIRLSLSPTNLKRFYIDFGSDRNKLLDVENWGTANWTSMLNAFHGCSNLNISATDVPDLSLVTNCYRMFRSCSSMTGPTNINSWNTSAITGMSGMFTGASLFNQNIGAWNTSAVFDMSEMFSAASSFNQNIGAWNTGAVYDMSNMFRNASAFNQNIGTWNTSAVSDMSGMFYGASSFNQNIGAWNTAAVTNMNYMFYGASSFNQNIGAWNTGSVNNMGNMFSSASAFNQNIGAWNTSAVTFMDNMFVNANAFNQNISTWNTSAVIYLTGMFMGATTFNQNISAWNTSAVTNMNNMFRGASAFNQDISAWNTSAVTNMSDMFNGASAFNQNIGAWTLNATVNLSNMLNNSGISCQNYSATLQGWSANPLTPNNRILGASNMEYGAYAATARTNLVSSKSWTISGDAVGSCDDRFITKWQLPTGQTTLSFNCERVGGAVAYTWQQLPSGATGSGSFAVGNGVVSISGLPSGGTIRLNLSPTNLKRFYINNGSHKDRLLDVENWGAANWKSMASAFYGCYNLNITATDVPDLSLVSNCSFMFRACSSLTGPSNINFWNTGAVSNMQGMFYSASAFNQNIGAWNTSNVIEMSDMFNTAITFNQNISAWNTAAVNYLSNMFRNASAFNQNLGAWNTSAVTDMSFMFYNASAFNQNIGTWNTNIVTDMSYMFYNANTFNQSIAAWNTGAVTNMSNMFSFALAFNQNIGTWTLNAGVNLSNMLNNCGMSCTNYSNTLLGLTNNNPTVTNRTLGAANLTYGTNAVSARNTLTSTRAWTINGDIANPSICSDDFITQWQLLAGQTTLTFNCERVGGTVAYTWQQLPSGASGSGNFVVGNGAVSISGLPSGATIRLSISPTNLKRFYIKNGTDKNRLLYVEKWGTANWTNMAYAFYGCANLTIPATDIPNLSNTLTTHSMFRNCTSLASIPNLNSWNLSNIVSAVSMFNGASLFNQIVSSWNTSAISDMSLMFNSASAFDQSLGTWTLNANADFSNMLNNCGMSCTNYSKTLMGWATNNPTVTNRTLGANNLTYGTNAVSARNTLTSTRAWTINGDIANPSICSNDFITRWQLPAGQTTLTFNCERVGGAVAYTWQQLPSGTTGSGSFAVGNGVVSISGLPSGGNIRLSIESTNLKRFYINNGTDKDRLLDVENWGTTNWKSMLFAFYGCSNLNITATDVPDLSLVSDCSSMFRACSSLSGPSNINTWNTSAVTSMSNMFMNASAFNQNIGAWNTSNVLYMSSMFLGASSFNQPIGSWNTSNVTQMFSMFSGASAFNQNISAWNTNAVTHMTDMFNNASSFNQNLNSWNTSAVTFMGNMFLNASSFNQPLDSWNTSAM